MSLYSYYCFKWIQSAWLNMPGNGSVDSALSSLVPWYKTDQSGWDLAENVQNKTSLNGLSDSQKQKLIQCAFSIGVLTITKGKYWWRILATENSFHLSFCFYALWKFHSLLYVFKTESLLLILHHLPLAFVFRTGFLLNGLPFVINPIFIASKLSLSSYWNPTVYSLTQ